MAEREKRLSPVGLLGDALLLLCALVGLTACFLSLYGGQKWNALMSLRYTPLDLCAQELNFYLPLAALFALLALAAWSPPRFQWTAGGLTALWGLAVYANWEAVGRGALLTVHTISLLFAQRVDWGRVIPCDLVLTLPEERAAVRLFLVLALAGLALLAGWAVVRARRWWIMALLTLPPLLPGLLADLYPDWPAFLALCACWCAMLLGSLCRGAAPSARGRLTLAALAAAALVLAGITLAFPREGYTRPPWALQAEEDLADFANRAANWLPRWEGSPFHGTITFVGSAEEADLAHAGPLSYTGRTVLRVKTDYEGRLYLRGSSLAVYEDGVWKALPEGTYEEYSPKNDPRPFPLYFPARLPGHGSGFYTATVDNVGAVGACVYAPYHLVPPEQDAEETGILPVEDAYLARKEGQWSHTMSFVIRSAPDAPLGDDVIYNKLDDKLDAVYAELGGIDAELSAGIEQYARFVYAHYLDVPDELRDTLDQYVHMWFSAQSSFHSAPGSIPPVQLAQELGAFLGTLCQYDANAPAAPDGADPVLYFLNVSRRGYCMHYASAVTLMLRTQGIPARYVSGFTADTLRDRQVDVPDRAAHAWVEVWVEGFGWYPVEVTPAAAFEPPEQSGGQDPWEETLPPLDEPSAPVPTTPPSESSAPSQGPNTPGGPGGQGDGPSQGPPAALPAVLKGLAALAGACGLLWLIQFAVKRRRTQRLSGADRNRAALYAYRCLERLARWGGRIDPVGVELAEKAKYSPHTLTEAELAALIRLVDRERTRLAAGLAWWKRLLFRYFWGMPSPPVFDRSP